jgi:hypothetical protein
MAGRGLGTDGTTLARVDAHVTSADLQAAALVFARALREHVAEGLARGQLETVISGARCLEHLAGLAGSAVAAQAFKTACQKR